MIIHPTQYREPPPAFYDIRWRFDFANRPSKYGKWSSPGNSPELKAHLQMREGLVRACVEGKNRNDPSDVRALAQCDGHDFVNFKWMALASMPGNFRGTVKPVHRLQGMQLVTREFNYFVFPDGSVKKKPRLEGEKKINYAIFGR
jgi:hypothetical protein